VHELSWQRPTLERLSRASPSSSIRRPAAESPAGGAAEAQRQDVREGLGAIYRRELAGLFLARWPGSCFPVLLYQAYFFLLALDAKGGEVNAALAFVLGGATPFLAPVPVS
jgi:hypothetical protein